MLVFSELKKIEEAWEKAEFSDEDFLAEFPEFKDKIDFGCTFTPEKCENLEHAWFCLKFLVNDLGIKQIRFGLRWNKISTSPYQLDLAYYRPFLDFMIANRLKICLSVGPIKTPDFPEEHIPDWIWQRVKKPKKRAHIQKDDLLAIKALVYQEELFRLLHKDYTKEQLKNITTIQVENECFIGFGQFRLKTSQEYLKEVIKLTGKYFEDVPILLNSSGRVDLRPILQQIKLWKKEKKPPKFVVGLDYYYVNGYTHKFRADKILDPLAISFPFDMTVASFLKQSAKLNIQTEVTEAQMEPWHPAIEPGNFLNSLKYVLQRAGSFLNFVDNQAVFRLWGVEYLTKQFWKNEQTKEHIKIKEFIQKCQKM